MAIVTTTRARALRLAAGLAAAAAAAGGLAACGSSSGSASASADKGTVTVGIPTDDPSYAPLYLAADRDTFAKHGVKVKLVTFSSGSDLTKAVAGGSVDIAVSALSEMMPAVLQHQPLKAFYGGYNQTTFAWYGQKGATSVQQGKGKKWAVTKVGSSTDFLTRYLFKKNGLDPETGATVIGVGASAAQVAALKAKQVDFTSASSLTQYKLAALGYPVVARQSDFAKEYPNHVAYAKSSFLTSRKQDATKFLQGMVDGFDLAKSDPKAAAQEIATHMKTTPELGMKTYQDDLAGWDADGRLPSQQDMDVFWQIGVLNGQWPKAIPASQWLDDSFIKSYPQWSKGGSAGS